MNDEIIALAASKQFEDLSYEEQFFVRKTLTESEYRKLSQTLGLLPKIDAGVVPPPHLKAALLSQFNNNQPRIKVTNQVWYNYPVALWQAAAAVVLILAGAWLFKNEPAQPEVIVKTQTVIHTDTVLVEKVMWKERVVFRNIQSPKDIIMQQNEMAGVDSIIVPTSRQLEADQPISAQPELLQFFTGDGGQ